MIHVKGIDAKQEKGAALLRYLQLATLEGDEPLGGENGHWWIAYDDGLPVAFAGLAQSVRWIDAGYLCRCGVLRSHRGMGIQKRLIRVRERKARELGWNWLISDTLHNPASANSLISCGFRMFLPSRPWSLPGAVYWRKSTGGKS